MITKRQATDATPSRRLGPRGGGKATTTKRKSGNADAASSLLSLALRADAAWRSPFDTSSAPFGMLELPPLRESASGAFALRKAKAPPLLRSFYRGLMPWGGEENWVLVEPASRRLWMSIAPMERESLALQVSLAEGRVLVGGLGMGLVVYNLLLSPKVSEVVVVEKSRDVVATLAPQVEEWRAGISAARSAVAGVSIICEDVIEYCERTRCEHSYTGEPCFDAALIDIWPSMGDTDIEPDMRRIAATGIAERYGAWTIEFAYVTWLQEVRKFNLASRPLPRWEEFEESIGVPLLESLQGGYEEWAVKAVINQVLS